MNTTTITWAAAATLLGACTILDPGGSDGGPCSSARLLAGAPGYKQSLDASQWTPSGYPAFAEPPLRMLNFSGRGNQLLVSTQQALWQLDTTAASPVFRRVLGDDTVDPVQYRPSGTCAAARVMVGDGVAFLPDGRAVIGDAWANGVLELSDPFGPGCSVQPIAGTQQAVDVVDLGSGQLFGAGDVDGPGASARFRRPTDATSDGEGNVYVWDAGNQAIKRIAGDAGRTVTRIFDLPGDMNSVNAMVALGGKLYAAGSTSAGDRIVEIDPASGATRMVIDGPVFPDVSGTTGVPIAMTTDGSDLLVYLWRGFVYRVSRSGDITLVAGSGRTESSSQAGELPHEGLDPLALPLEFAEMTSYANLYWNAGHLYVQTAYANTGHSIWDLTCE